MTSNWSELEKYSWQKRLRDWDLFMLKKRWLQDELNSNLSVTATCKEFIKVRLFTVVHDGRMIGSGHKMKQCLPLLKLSMHLASKCYSMSSESIVGFTATQKTKVKSIGLGLVPAGNIDEISVVGEEGISLEQKNALGKTLTYMLEEEILSAIELDHYIWKFALGIYKFKVIVQFPLSFQEELKK
ncbi:hypothetical protein BTVI_42814 [Pitangus sulphuratus]|nr:hypothetical protein BTVI_42814 [Pitangus sulphuratus]